MTFPLERLDKASLKHPIHMLKDMLKLAKKEIINLWILFVFLKTTCPDQDRKYILSVVVLNQPFGPRI